MCWLLQHAVLAGKALRLAYPAHPGRQALGLRPPAACFSRRLIQGWPAQAQAAVQGRQAGGRRQWRRQQLGGRGQPEPVQPSGLCDARRRLARAAGAAAGAGRAAAAQRRRRPAAGLASGGQGGRALAGRGSGARLGCMQHGSVRAGRNEALLGDAVCCW